jgi:putative membrane protein
MLFSSLIIEIIFLKQNNMTIQSNGKILKVDLFFGISAGVILISGLLRMFNLGKGVDFLFIQPLIHH